MLDAARRAASEALLDRTMIAVTPEAYAEFLARLDAPPLPNDRLRRTMQTLPLGPLVTLSAPELLSADHQLANFDCGVPT